MLIDESIIDQLSDKLYEIGKPFGFSKPVVHSDRLITEIYIINTHAIQIEIDWMENNLFMYAVYLFDGNLPESKVIYNYPNGQWCRRYLEEVYKTKRFSLEKSKNRYTHEYLFECFEFYEKLIKNDPIALIDYFRA